MRIIKIYKACFRKINLEISFKLSQKGLLFIETHHISKFYIEYKMKRNR